MATATTSSTHTTQQRDWLRLLGIAATLLGLFVAAYMSYAELTGAGTSCPGATGEDILGEPGSVAVDCGFVQSSVYAKLFGIPVAVVGFGGYLAILAVWLLEDRIQLLADFGHVLVFGMALFGFLFSLYLTYVEFFIIYTLCTWCLTSAIFMTAVFIIATVRLVRGMAESA